MGSQIFVKPPKIKCNNNLYEEFLSSYSGIARQTDVAKMISTFLHLFNKITPDGNAFLLKQNLKL
jgi:hypothetical protein